MMDADALHEAFPFTEELVFNEARCLWIACGESDADPDCTCHADAACRACTCLLQISRCLQDSHPAHPNPTLPSSYYKISWKSQEMLKSEFSEKLIPDESCIMGVRSDGKPHRFCVGNEQGEILPKFLMGQRTRCYLEPAIL